MKDNHLYVACIRLEGRPCLVVGGGPVAREKVDGLLAAGADVTLVAPEAVEELERLAAEDEIEWARRTYESDDVKGRFLAIAATSDTELNTRVFEDAENENILVNVADVPHLCNFILPAVVRDGPLALAVSTAGASPALAQRMRREASERFRGGYAELAWMLEELRPWAKDTLPTYRDRKAFFDDIVNGDPDPIRLLREGRRDEVRQRIETVRERHLAALESRPG